MATAIGQDTVTSIARRYIMPEIADTIYNSNILFYRLTKANKKMVQGGYQIEHPIQYARPTNVQAYSGFDVLNVAPFDVVRNAVWDWKQYAATVTVDGLTMLKTDSPEAIANLISTNFDITRMEFEQVLGADMYAGSSSNSKKLDGLADAVASSGTYGGINHSNTYWSSKRESSLALGSLTIDSMLTLFGDLTIGREHPTLIVARQAVYNKYAALVYGTGGANYDITVPAAGSDEILANAGFTNLLFNNVPFVVDSQVDASTGSNGKMYFLNENHLSLVVSPRADMALEEFQTPVNQDAMVAKILFAGNVCAWNPRLQGAFTAL